jgi:hypothetical protein
MQRTKASRTALCAFLFTVLAIAPVFAQGKLESLFDFSASIQSLAAAAEKETALPVGRYVIITGTLRAAEALESSGFSVRLELVTGQWEGTSRIILRTVYVGCSGEAFRSLFERDSPDCIRLGSTVLVVAKVSGMQTGPDGVRRVYLEGVHVRCLD